MYYNYFTGIESIDSDPVEFTANVVETCIEKWEESKITNVFPEGIIVPELYTGNFLKKRHSIHADISEVEPQEIYLECYNESEMLRRIVVNYHGLVLNLMTSNIRSTYKFNAFKHYYLNNRFSGREVIVEPTLGQFINEYRGIFVGTREELKKAFLSHLALFPNSFNDNWARYRELSNQTPERMFEVIWGTTELQH